MNGSSVGKVVEYSLSAFIVVAIISVIVSTHSTTPGVLQAIGAALTNILATIVAPISTGTAAAAAASATTQTNTSAIGTATAAGISNPTITSQSNTNTAAQAAAGNTSTTPASP